jgi:hypothetical protein
MQAWALHDKFCQAYNTAKLNDANGGTKFKEKRHVTAEPTG